MSDKKDSDGRDVWEKVLGAAGQKTPNRRIIDRAIRDERVLRELYRGRSSLPLLAKQKQNQKIIDALRRAHRHGRPETPKQKAKSEWFKRAERAARSRSQYGEKYRGPPHWDEYGYDDDLGR